VLAENPLRLKEGETAGKDTPVIDIASANNTSIAHEARPLGGPARCPPPPPTKKKTQEYLGPFLLMVRGIARRPETDGGEAGVS
jgi:hypothetical protein